MLVGLLLFYFFHISVSILVFKYHTQWGFFSPTETRNYLPNILLSKILGKSAVNNISDYILQFSSGLEFVIFAIKANILFGNSFCLIIRAHLILRCTTS